MAISAIHPLRQHVYRVTRKECIARSLEPLGATIAPLENSRQTSVAPIASLDPSRQSKEHHPVKVAMCFLEAISQTTGTRSVSFVLWDALRNRRTAVLVSNALSKLTRTIRQPPRVLPVHQVSTRISRVNLNASSVSSVDTLTRGPQVRSSALIARSTRTKMSGTRRRASRVRWDSIRRSPVGQVAYSALLVDMGRQTIHVSCVRRKHSRTLLRPHSVPRVQLASINTSKVPKPVCCVVAEHTAI